MVFDGGRHRRRVESSTSSQTHPCSLIVVHSSHPCSLPNSSQFTLAPCGVHGEVLYPEGTRSLLPEGLPLKLGALGAAYELQWPVQA